MKVAVQSHVGNIRQVNEDRAEYLFRDKQHLLAVVADGMGGHQAGDVASQMAIQQLLEAFRMVDVNKSQQEWQEWLLNSLQEINTSVFQYAQEHQECYGMGTTIVAGLFLEDYYIVVHVGDSRLYRVGKEGVQVITKDHSLVNELLRSGQITEQEALFHPQRNVITRALGTEPSIEAELQRFSYSQEQYFLLCSDGFSNLVGQVQMQEVLEENSTSIEEKTTKLVELALDAGGDDNISIILVQSARRDQNNLLSHQEQK